MIKITEFKKSDRKGKKYKIVFDIDGKKNTVHFGAKGYEDYTIHKDDKRKERYIDRHKKNEDWKDPTKPGTLSRYILWNKKTLADSFKDYVNKFNLKISI